MWEGQNFNTFGLDNKKSGLDNLLLIICISSILFLLYPLFGCVVCISLTFIANDKRGVGVSFILLWVLVILIQSNRELQPVIDYKGDWGRYGDFYDSSSTYTVFFTDLGQKDLAFTCWNFLCHYIFGNHYLAYADFTVDVEMLLYGLSSYRFWKNTGTDARFGLCALVLTFFFSEIILISNNLLRQQFATAIMVYALVLRYTHGKGWPIFLIWGFLTHSMTLVFIPLFILPIAQKIPQRILIYGAGVFIGVAILFNILKGFFLSSSLYVFQRIGGAEEYFSSDVIDPIVILKFAIICVIIFAKHYFFDGMRNKYLWFGINVLLYITAICILTSSMPLLVTRVYIDRLPLLSMTIPYIFIKRTNFNTIFQTMLIIFFIIRFALLSHGEYLDVSSLSQLSMTALIY